MLECLPSVARAFQRSSGIILASTHLPSLQREVSSELFTCQPLLLCTRKFNTLDVVLKGIKLLICCGGCSMAKLFSNMILNSFLS